MLGRHKCKHGKNAFNAILCAVSGVPEASFLLEPEQLRINLKCGNDLVGVIIDRFGKDVMIMPVDDQHFHTHVNVTVSPQFFGWLAALGVSVEIISPAHVRESYRAYINMIAANYNQTLDHSGPK